MGIFFRILVLLLFLVEGTLVLETVQDTRDEGSVAENLSMESAHSLAYLSWK